jgi:hypothetical protein
MADNYFRTDPRGVSELMGDALDQFTKLLRAEVAIARTELSEKAGEAARGIGMIAGGAMLLVPALVLILMALAAFLNELGLALSLSYLISAAVGFVIAGILAAIGKSRLSAEHLMPKHTVREFKRDVSAAREHS